MGLDVIISALFANLFTSFVKPEQHSFTAESIAARKAFIRVVNAVIGVVMLVATSWLLGEPFDASQLESYISIIVTFLGSQGAYHLFRGS